MTVDLSLGGSSGNYGKKPLNLSLAGASGNYGKFAPKPLGRTGAQPIQNDFMQAPNLQSPSLSLAGGNMPLGSQDNLNLGFGNENNGGFDWTNAMGNFAMGAEGITGLAGAYSAYKQLGLLEDQLNLQKNMANRNIANQATVTNEQLDARADMAAQISGKGTEHGTEAHKAAKEKLLTQVDGSPIG
jgi:hypothetical protein